MKMAGQGQVADLEGDQLGGDGGAHVGAQNNPRGLGEVHQPGVDKTHHGHGGHRGGLDHRGDQAPVPGIR